jgi:hypothetical protein
VLTQTQITSSSPSSSDNTQTKLTLSNGSELFADLYLPALGSTPLSSYIPTHLLDPHKRLLTTESTLRVHPTAGPLVYALGDITSFTTGGIPEIQSEVPVLASNMKRDLIAAHAGNLSAKPQGIDRTYEPERRELQLVPVGSVPSWAVWLIKGRDYLVGKSVGRLYGEGEVKEVKWLAEGQSA